MEVFSTTIRDGSPRFESARRETIVDVLYIVAAEPSCSQPLLYSRFQATFQACTITVLCCSYSMYTACR